MPFQPNDIVLSTHPEHPNLTGCIKEQSTGYAYVQLTSGPKVPIGYDYLIKLETLADLMKKLNEKTLPVL